MILGLLLAIFEAGAAESRVFYVYNAANGLADNSAQTITCTKTGRLVITTMGQINFFDGQQFNFIDPSSENIYPLSHYNGHYHLYFDKYHHLWLKHKHTVTCVNLTTEQFVENVVDEFRALGMEDKVQDLFVDQRNIIWLLTEKGLFCSENKQYYEVRKKLNLQDLMTYGDNYLMLFYENGMLDILEIGSGKCVHTSTAYDASKQEKYNKTTVVTQVGDSFYQIRNGNMGAILQRFDYKAKKWETLMETPYYLSGVKEKDSVLYVPCAYGYWTYDLKTGQSAHEEELTMSTGQKLLTDINAIEFDRQGGMWVGTQMRGLLYSRPYTSPFHIYSWTDSKAMELYELLEKHGHKLITTYHDKVVNCVFRDSRGWDWVGTTTGLQLFKKRSDKLPQVLTRTDGLQNNVVHSIVEDKLHNIWVGTSYGISCVLIEDGQIRYLTRYNDWDGIPKESFVDGRAVLLPDGSIVMQALDHMIQFNPGKMTTIQNDFPFEIYPKLIRLLVNGNDVRVGQQIDGKVILQKALTRTKTISLDYNQNTVSLTFSGLNYFRPQQTYYRCRVSGPGMDDRWRVYTPYNSQGLVDTRGQFHLPMVSLTPGKYTIELQCSMVPDVWTSTPYKWEIEVNQPWWRTTGVLFLLGLILAIMFGVYIYLFVRNTNMRARRNTEELSVLKRIKSFADRCDARKGMTLEPVIEDMMGEAMPSLNEFSPKFVQTMISLLPAVAGKSANQLKMRELSEAAGMSLPDFYSIVSANIYKNPRSIVMEVMMSRAERLLKEGGRGIEEIAKECGFSTPNFFIATYYHKHKQLPTVHAE